MKKHKVPDPDELLDRAVNFRLRASDYKILERMARSQNRSVSSLIRLMIEDQLHQRAE